MYKILSTVATLVLLPAVASQHVMAQACCSAGPPLLGSLEFSSVREQTSQLALTYEFNSVNDLVDQSSKLANDTRHRRVHSWLLEATHGVTSAVSITLLMTAVQQERQTEILSGENSLVRIRGFGDAVVLVKYAVVKNSLPDQREVAVGLGTKIPFGSSSRSHGGILLPADLQPGTGAWDGILWAYASQGFLPAAPLTLYAVGSARLTGVNDQYGPGKGGYKFGNETLLSFGAGYRTDGFLDYSFSIRARHSGADRFDGGVVPNTGGFWLTVIPGLNFKLSDDMILRGTFQYPLYRTLTGVQLTTSFTTSATLIYTIG